MLSVVEEEALERRDWYIFVHGPHRRGASLGYQLADVPLFSGKSSIRGKLWQSGSQAALVRDPAADARRVIGDIYRVDEDRLRMLDDFHGIPAGSATGLQFRRVWAEVLPAAGVGIMAWTWEWTGPVEDAVAVPSGDWTDVERPRKQPTLTMLAAGLMLAAPLAIALAFFVSPRSVSLLLVVLGLSSPLIAAFACYFAGRRRERWSGLRFVLWLLLGFIGFLVAVASVAGS